MPHDKAMAKIHVDIYGLLQLRLLLQQQQERLGARLSYGDGSESFLVTFV